MHATVVEFKLSRPEVSDFSLWRANAGLISVRKVPILPSRGLARSVLGPSVSSSYHLTLLSRTVTMWWHEGFSPQMTGLQFAFIPFNPSLSFSLPFIFFPTLVFLSSIRSSVLSFLLVNAFIKRNNVQFQDNQNFVPSHSRAVLFNSIDWEERRFLRDRIWWYQWWGLSTFPRNTHIRMASALTMSMIALLVWLVTTVIDISLRRSEAIEGALPVCATYPQQSIHAIYAENFSGTSFNTSWYENQPSCLHRTLATINHHSSTPRESSIYHTHSDPTKLQQVLNQCQCDPCDLDESVDWVHSLNLVTRATVFAMRHGLGIFIFAAGKSMDSYSAIYSAESDFIIVLRYCVPHTRTNFGSLPSRPNEICTVSRVFATTFLSRTDQSVAILEFHQNKFQLPKLWRVESKCLANAPNFRVPVALCTDDFSGSVMHVPSSKASGDLSATSQNQTLFDVVTWYDLCNPHKHDPTHFKNINSISCAQPDSNINALLSHLSSHLGTVVINFINNSLRWLWITGTTFQFLWYHWNRMSEFMDPTHGLHKTKCYKRTSLWCYNVHQIFQHGVQSDGGSYLRAIQIIKVRESGLKKCAKLQSHKNNYRDRLKQYHRDLCYRMATGIGSSERLLAGKTAFGKGNYQGLVCWCPS